MSIYSQYTDDVRKSASTWSRGADAVTDGARQILSQVQKTIATAVQVDPSERVFDYLKRTLDAQSEVGKKFAALSVEFSEQVLAQGEALAQATRDYTATAQEVLRDQAGRQYDEFVAARQRAEDAIRQVQAPAEARRNKPETGAASR